MESFSVPFKKKKSTVRYTRSLSISITSLVEVKLNFSISRKNRLGYKNSQLCFKAMPLYNCFINLGKLELSYSFQTLYSDEI